MAYLSLSYARDRQNRRWQIVAAAMAMREGSAVAEALQALDD